MPRPGVLMGQEKIKIKIPAGIENGQAVKLSGKGEAGAYGLPAGDLYIHLVVLPDPQFTREGDDIYTVKTINFSQAVLGDKIRVQTLDGEIKLKIPSGTPSGRQFVVKGKGAYRFHKSGRGNLIVKIEVLVPKDLTRHQKELMEDLNREGL